MQRRAEKLCGVTFQPLGARREASCFRLICKLLDEVCVQPLLDILHTFSFFHFSFSREKKLQVCGAEVERTLQKGGGGFEFAIKS